MSFFFSLAGFIDANPLSTKSIRVDSAPPQDCSSQRCGPGTNLCTICCNWQGFKNGVCVNSGTSSVCKCQG